MPYREGFISTAYGLIPLLWHEGDRAMGEGSYIQFGVEGVPFSAVRVELTDDVGADVARAVGAALELQAAWNDAFRSTEGVMRNPDSVERQPVYDDHPNAPGNSREPQGRAQQRGNGQQRQQSSNEFGGATFWCPEHNAELRPSVKNANKDWDDDLQMDVPASWFHSLDGGKTCSVWRSKAQIRMPAGAR